MLKQRFSSFPTFEGIFWEGYYAASEKVEYLRCRNIHILPGQIFKQQNNLGAMTFL